MKDRFGLVMLVVIVFLAGFWTSSWSRDEDSPSERVNRIVALDSAQMDSFRVAASWSAIAYEKHVRKLTEEEVALYVSLVETIRHPCPMPTWKIKQMVTDNILKMALVSVEELHRAQGDTLKR